MQRRVRCNVGREGMPLRAVTVFSVRCAGQMTTAAVYGAGASA